MLFGTLLLGTGGVATASGRDDVNTPAHKREPGLRIIGANDGQSGEARDTSSRNTTANDAIRTAPRRARLASATARHDPQVRPARAESYDDGVYRAGAIGAEGIPAESIHIDRQSGDYIAGGDSGDEYVDGDYADGDYAGGGGYHSVGAGQRRRWAPIQNMIGRSWDHDDVGESWLTRPYYVGGYLGAMFGDELVNNEIDLQEGFFGGGRIGWDFSRTWSAEGRLASAAMPVKFLGHEARDNSDVVLGDIDLLWYPWGDTPWRPYLQVGFGFAQFQYRGFDNYNYDKTVFGIPWGIGFRHRWTPKWSWRLELLDNVAFGGSELIETMHNVTLTGGIEYRFGGSHRTYWPWDPGRQNW
jgi:hypothetical protein